MGRRALWILGIAFLFGACGRGDVKKTAMALTGGDPDRGPDLIRKYGCGSCHNVPGVPGAKGMVGPPLDTIAGRTYLAGQLPNTPENLMLWIRKPQDVAPGTAMPDVGVTEKDGRDIAAYLYTLR